MNAYTTGRQTDATLAVDRSGNFLVAFTDGGHDGSSAGAFAQRFGGLVPAALAVDAPDNGVFEPGETVSVEPSWRNVNGAAQAFEGAVSRFTGPGPATYDILDGVADYGTVANGLVGSCTSVPDCFRLRATAPSRPAPHWDATVREDLSPDLQGQTQTWVLHIGDSFADTPRTNPFYRFVETLFHHGVTGGCNATQYCPASSTTREQMAVFVLVARDGAGYLPPACTSPVFADVPASSPFCRWIEELARRSVISGCGGGNYCPSSAVTREQMAAFVLRTLDPGLDPPACGTPVFADVPASSPFCKWIEELARRGVVTGCGGVNYCPAAPVTREQMGVFIGATFGLALYAP